MGDSEKGGIDMTPAALPLPVRSYLAAYVKRRRRLAVLRAAGWTVALLLTWLLLNCIADRHLHMSQLIREWLLAAGLIAVVGFTSGSLGLALFGRVDWTAAATGIDTRLATITSQCFTPPAQRGSEQLLEAIVADLEPEMRATPPARLISAMPAWRAWIAAAVLLGVFASLWNVSMMGMPEVLGRVIKPWESQTPAASTVREIAPTAAVSGPPTTRGEEDSEYQDSLQAYFQALHRAEGPTK